MSEVAAIDCGTNSIKLLIGDLPYVSYRDSQMVRLGQGVDATGRLADEAMARTFEAIEEFAGVIRAHRIPPERVRFCATSATRDSANADDFIQGVRHRLGVVPEVLSGEEEAALVFAGSTRGRPGLDGPVLVVDIGGGSTEMVLGDSGPTHSVSMDIGSVRLHERHLHDDPPTDDQVERMRDDIDAALDAAPVPIEQARTVIGTSGTIKTVAAGLLHLVSYDRDALDGAVLPVELTHQYVDALMSMTVEQRRTMPYMHPGRADVVAAGAMIWSHILERAGVEQYLVSEADILYGIGWSLTERG